MTPAAQIFQSLGVYCYEARDTTTSHENLVTVGEICAVVTDSFKVQ